MLIIFHSGFIIYLFGLSHSRADYPHPVTSRITVFAPAAHHSVFAAGDDEGRVSLWHMPRNKELNALSPSSVVNAQALRRIAGKFQPQLLATLSLADCDVLRPSDESYAHTTPAHSSSEQQERILKLHFICGDRYLVVSSNKRMVLVDMRFSPLSPQDARDKLMLYESLRNRSNSITNLSAVPVSPSPSLSARTGPQTITGFARWMQMDRALPGRLGLFDFFVQEQEVEQEKELERDNGRKERVRVRVMERRMVQWRVIENDEEEEELSRTLTRAQTQSQAQQQRGRKRKCTVSRLEWSQEMFDAALEQMKPFARGAELPVAQGEEN